MAGIEAREQRGRWFLVVVVVILVFLAMRNLSDDDDGDDAEPLIAGTVTIHYDVGGTATYADVTMETPLGTEQISPDIPMTRKATGERGLDFDFEPGDFVYISAQNNTALGEVTCTITASDGSVISNSSSSVDYGIATCDGTAR